MTVKWIEKSVYILEPHSILYSALNYALNSDPCSAKGPFDCIIYIYIAFRVSSCYITQFWKSILLDTWKICGKTQLKISVHLNFFCTFGLSNYLAVKLHACLQLLSARWFYQSSQCQICVGQQVTYKIR